MANLRNFLQPIRGAKLRELYQRIWRNTWRAQIVLIVLSIAVAALAAAPLQLQKDVINGLSTEMELRDLLLLGALYLGVLLLSAALKALMNYRTSIVGEATIRRARTKICFRQEHESQDQDNETLPPGTLATMVTTESEEVGKFVGAAIASPLMQVGTLVSVVAFIAWNQPYLGLIVMCVISPQAIIVLTLQKHINARIAERVKALRHATNLVVEEDIKRVQEAVLADFDDIFEARRKIFLMKQSMKFALGAINGMGIAGILVLGGWLVLEARADVGTVVATLSGLERISQPWRELIAFYRDLSAVRVKYQLLLPAIPKLAELPR